MDLEDEDVTFENSLLGQHLQEVGFGELGLEAARTQENIGVEADAVAWQESADQSGKNEQCQPPAAAVTMVTLRKEAAAAVWRAIWKSGLLEEEDAALLQHLHPEWVEAVPASRSLLHTVAKYMGRFCVTTAAVSALWCSGLLPSSFFVRSPYQDRLACLFTIAAVGLPSLVGLAHNSWQVVLDSQDLSRIQEFLATIHEMRKVMKKAIRLVQETELVSRGFTMARFVSTAEKFELQNKREVEERQCPRLRQLLFHSARGLVKSLKGTTMQLIEESPLGHSVGDSWNYLAKVPLEEYGGCVTCQDEDELKHLTDNFSISALKAMVQLYNLHCSEYLQRLALMAVWTSQGLDKVHVSTIELQTHLQKHITELNQSLHFHQDMVLEQPSTQPQQSKAHSPAAALYTAVHSLDLHLQAALRRGRNLTRRLEAQQEKEDPAGSSLSKCTEQLALELEGIKLDIEACRECWEEAQLLLDKSVRPTKKQEENSPLEQQVNKATQPESKPIPLFEGEGPIIQDEVFEAYTDPTDVESTSWGSEQLLSQEEREQKKKQKREAMRMLKELRSVISVRAHDREERERKALERARHNVNGQSQGDDDFTGGAGDNQSVATSEPRKEDKQNTQEQICKGITSELATEGVETRLENKNSDTVCSNEVNSHYDTSQIKQVSSDIQESQGDFTPSSVDVADRISSTENGSSTPHNQKYENSSPSSEDTRKTDNWYQETKEEEETDLPEEYCPSDSEDEETEFTPKESEIIKKRREELVAKVQRFSGTPFAMAGGVAAMVAQRSQDFMLQEETIGDSESEEEDEQ